VSIAKDNKLCRHTKQSWRQNWPYFFQQNQKTGERAGKKKVCWNEINIKYKSLIEIVIKCIEDNHLNFVLVMALFQKAEENKCCLWIFKEFSKYNFF
jgi:hypothetical protein